MATTGRAGRIALVARTASDVRDVVVEGESGILRISPASERPEWNSSRRRLTWPNGAIATTYSADEPDQLRGPQHDAAWVDELCLVAGTMVATPYGEVAIELIQCGDLVCTRDGPRAVVRAWCTSSSAEVWELETDTGAVLQGTAAHPVFVRDIGFIPLASVRYGATMEAWDQQSIGAVNAGTETSPGTTRAGAESSCIGRYGNPCTALSRHPSTSTTSTTTLATTTSTTFGRSVDPSTCESTAPAGSSHGPPDSTATERRPCGTVAPRLASSATTAAQRSTQLGCGQSSAVRTAPPLSGEQSTQSHARDASIFGARRSSALSAAFCSRPTTRALQHVHAPAGSRTSPRVVGLRKLRDRAAVFNIEVEGAHEYFANGLLTHNCSWRYPEAFDQLRFGLRLGERPQVVVTTTPRPTPIVTGLIRAPGTVVTRGRTRDNAVNLAAGVVADLERRYAGTRLGRQELDGEILTDAPGALWKWAPIEAARVESAPALRRVVVAIDPAATSGDESDETGIVVAGLGWDDRVYVLADASGRYAPTEWARRAIAAYRTHEADRIVAEVNNGGEMVTATLRMIEPGAPVRTVHASRGKAVRAEPVAALYEQGRVSHVGPLAMLEDQMTTWDPGTSRKSPDRIDALVWALTDLAVDPQRERGPARESDYDF